MAAVVASLLATGHYTNPDHPSDETPLIRYDVGEDWEEYGEPHRYCTKVVDDAEIIVAEIIHSFRERQILNPEPVEDYNIHPGRL